MSKLPKIRRVKENINKKTHQNRRLNYLLILCSSQSPKLIIIIVTLKIKRWSKIPEGISLHTEGFCFIMRKPNRWDLIHLPSIHWRYGNISCIVSLLIRDVSFLVVGSLEGFADGLVYLLLTVPVFRGEGDWALESVLLVLILSLI